MKSFFPSRCYSFKVVPLLGAAFVRGSAVGKSSFIHDSEDYYCGRKFQTVLGPPFLEGGPCALSAAGPFAGHLASP